jgi:hypothetical protein
MALKIEQRNGVRIAEVGSAKEIFIFPKTVELDNVIGDHHI